MRKDLGLSMPRGSFLGFGWVTAFDGFFLSELKAKPDAASADCVMIFECVPLAFANNENCASETIGRIAGRMREQGKMPWTYGAASNTALIQGLQKAGFQVVTHWCAGEWWGGRRSSETRLG